MAAEIIRIDFRDVGQGDCTVITKPDGDLILIDVGPIGNPVVSWLASKPGRSVSDIILTHNDGDHAGALPGVVAVVSRQARRARLWLLKDRNPTGVEGRKMEKLFALASEAEEKGLLTADYLRTSHQFHKDPFHEIAVLYPKALESITEGSSPNRSSAIIGLIRSDGQKVIWPGDNLIETVVKHQGEGVPFLLHGPHHGAPEDQGKPQFIDHLRSLAGHKAFMSVGSKNRYNHPNPTYIRQLAQAGCDVTCSGLNKQCDRNFDSRKETDHVLDGTMLLGLGRSGSKIACRGSMTLWSTPDGLELDEWEQTHKARKAELGKARCILA